MDFGLKRFDETEVKIDPIEFRGPREKILEAFTKSDTAKDSVLNEKYAHVFDGRNMLYTSRELGFEPGEYNVSVETRPRRTEEAKIKFQEVGRTELTSTPQPAGLGSGGGDVRTMDAALEVIIRQTAYQNNTLAQKNFQAFGNFWSLGAGLAARYGIRLGVRSTRQGPVMFGDIEGGVFHEKMSVLDRLCLEIANLNGGRFRDDREAIRCGEQELQRNPNGNAVQGGIEKIQSLLNTLKVTLPRVRYGEKNERSKPTKMREKKLLGPANEVVFDRRIKDTATGKFVCEDPNDPTSKFKTESVTIERHQKEIHNVSLRFPSLPVADFGKKGGKWPIELLEIAEMQPLKKLPPAAQLDNLRRGPGGSNQSVQGREGVQTRKTLLESNKPCQDRYASAFGVSLDGGLMQCDARVLPIPQMMFGDILRAPRGRDVRPVEKYEYRTDSRGNQKKIPTKHEICDPRARSPQASADWSGYFQNNQFMYPGTLDRGIALFICGRFARDRNVEQYLAGRAVGNIAQWCLQLGMFGDGLQDAVRNGPKAVGGAERPEHADQSFGKMLMEYNSRTGNKGEKPGLVLVVMPGNMRTQADEWRGIISYLADYKYGVKTVRFREDKAGANQGGGRGGRPPKTIDSKDIMDNLAQKINVKCGGVNAGVVLPELKIRPPPDMPGGKFACGADSRKPLYLMMRDVAILGLDVNREGGLKHGQEHDSTSVVGMCCSLAPGGDLTSRSNRQRGIVGTAYFGTTGVIEGGKEAVAPDEMRRMTELLLNFRRDKAKLDKTLAPMEAITMEKKRDDGTVDTYEDYPFKPEESPEFGVKHFLPRWIVMMRDGVGREQFRNVIENEVEGIRKAVRNLVTPEELKAWRPRFTMIVAQKRGVRLFPDSQNIANFRSGNVIPGIVVDVGKNAPTDDGEFNFFLNSHKGGTAQGNNRVPSYSVIVDEVITAEGSDTVALHSTGKANDRFASLTYDEVENFVYSMTNTYGHCAITQRQPTPCLYAHQIALRGQKARVQGHSWCDLPVNVMPTMKDPEIAQCMYW